MLAKWDYMTNEYHFITHWVMQPESPIELFLFHVYSLFAFAYTREGVGRILCRFAG
jgi:hypothetical protein